MHPQFDVSFLHPRNTYFQIQFRIILIHM
jgi:hypothetical protein